MSDARDMTRRGFLGGTVLAAAATASLGQTEELYKITNGRVTQGVCQWSAGMPLDQLITVAKQIGLKGIDLVGKGDWQKLRDNGLVCSMVSSHGIGKGFNRIENHAECIKAVRGGIDDAAAVGFPNVICFSGNRAGLDDETGLKNCAEGLKQIVGYAEEKKITLCMELLNSKRNHKDYQCDRTAWGARLVDAVGSERFRLLYDIYHMQIDEGDVIDTIRQYAKKYFGHVHTAGVPGRNDIDESQELYYPAIMKALVGTGYTGFVSHEFMARGDKVKALAKAAQICDV
ncbi:MAG: TIM barrel protein [Armatimonadetes bacterium]|nr:TIM barrel protein [Armatimonadota bacterium]